MQPLAPQKPKSFIKFHGGSVSDLSLERNLHDSQCGISEGVGVQYLIGIPFYHDVEGFPNEFRCNSLPSIPFSNGEHGNIASHGPSPMRFQLRDNNADQIFILTQSLFFRSNTASNPRQNRLP